jgi:hypothetical protein
MCLNNCSALVLPVVEVSYFIVSLERRYRCFFTLNAVVKVPVRLNQLSGQLYRLTVRAGGSVKMAFLLLPPL